MKYKYLFFDFDGTVFDTSPGITECVSLALKAQGIEAAPADLLDFVGPPLEERFRERYGIIGEDFHKALAVFRKNYSSDGIKKYSIYPGMKEMLKERKEAGCRIAVATSKPEVMALEILEECGIRDCFDIVCGSLLDGTRVEKKDVLAEAIRRMQMPEEERCRALMIGDRKYDGMGARECGIDFAAVGYGFAQPGEWDEIPHAVLAPSVRALAEFLRE